MSPSPRPLRFALLLALTLVVCLAPSPRPAGAEPADKDSVDQKAVDEAIRKGAEFLKAGFTPGDHNPNTELVLLTLLHAGESLNDPAVSAALEYVKKLNITALPFKEKTYRVSLAAMCLEHVNKAAFQDRLAAFAKFLICNQCVNGQWAYGENVEGFVPSGGGGTVETGGGGDKPGGSRTGRETTAMRKVKVECERPIGPPTGDHSNTQFALLGLRACAEAAIEIPKEVWNKALRILEQGQRLDGGWSYSYPSPLDAAAGSKVTDAGASYGSMSCSGVCGLIICRYYLGQKSWKGDPAIQKGLEWIGTNFTVKENAKFADNPAPNHPGGGAVWHYYYLYALERTGMLAGVEKFGARKWYSNGARFLLKEQKPEGSWASALGDSIVQDTCFAILFLKKATKPITIKSGR